MVLYFWDLLIYQCERQLNFGTTRVTPQRNSIILQVRHAMNTEIFRSVTSNISLKSLKLGELGK